MSADYVSVQQLLDESAAEFKKTGLTPSALRAERDALAAQVEESAKAVAELREVLRQIDLCPAGNEASIARKALARTAGKVTP